MCSRLSSFDIIPHRPICRNLFLRKTLRLCAKVKRVTTKLLVATVVLRQIAIAHAKLWRAKNRSVAFCVKVEPYAQNQKVCSITVTLAGFILRKTLRQCAKPTTAVLVRFILRKTLPVCAKPTMPVFAVFHFCVQRGCCAQKSGLGAGDTEKWSRAAGLV